MHSNLIAAAELGIPVCNTPDYGTNEVADHAIGLMLALKRGIVSYHQHLVGRLRGRVFGVIGLGRIGIAAALRAKAFGMSVVAYDPLVSRGTEIAVGVERKESLEELLAIADVVSLHCPLTPETRGMMNARTLGTMRPEAILINTARSAIIDIDARRLAVETAMLYLCENKLRNLVNVPARSMLRSAS
jgi:phosphoglycerate dehydrogenase-like enzyme